jgi:hypothetical protein
MPTPGTARPTAAQLIRGAHAELTEHGWRQGDFTDDTGRLCLLGALRRAAGVHPLEEPADSRLACTLRDAECELARTLPTPDQATGTLDPVDVLTRWNDDPSRAADHVLAHLAAVADDLDPQPPAAARPHRTNPG